MMSKTVGLDVGKLSPDVEKLHKILLERVIGQERAIRQIIKAYVPTTVKMHRPNRPMGNFLFLGPTGVGKSETVKVFAQELLGDRKALTKIDCTEFQESHSVMKLLGAPPSYVGYGDTPRLAQKKIDQYQTKTCKVNIILFDEIEKADPRLFDAILAILGDGELTLGNGESVDFSRSFIFLTSNLGSREIRKLGKGGLGFGQSIQPSAEDTDDEIYRICKAEVEKKFRPEFSNRLDKMVVYRPLSQTTLRHILRLELADLHTRIWRSPFRDFEVGSDAPTPQRFSLFFALTPQAFDFILKEGTSELYGARELSRTVDRYLGFPLASLISSKQIGHGDKITIDLDGKDLKFEKVASDPTAAV